MGKEKVPVNIFFIGHVDPGQSTTIGHLIDKLGGIDQRVIKTAEKKDPTRAKGVIKTAEKKDPTRAKGVIKTAEKKDPTGAKGVIKTAEKKDPTRTKGVIKIVEKDTTVAKGVIMTGAKVTKVTKVTKHVIKTVEKIDYCANTKSVEKEEKKTRWLDIQRTTAVGVIKRVEKKDPTGAKVTKAATKKGAK